jgi:hypothetical protein
MTFKEDQIGAIRESCKKIEKGSFLLSTNFPIVHSLSFEVLCEEEIKNSSFLQKIRKRKEKVNADT